MEHDNRDELCPTCLEAGWFDRPSRMPGAIVEPLFMSEPAEASIATSRAGQDALSSALARAIQEYLSVRALSQD